MVDTILEGGRRELGVITTIVPPGFTNQGGASVFVNLIIGQTAIQPPEQLIIGTEFAFGIWPTIESGRLSATARV